MEFNKAGLIFTAQIFILCTKKWGAGRERWAGGLDLIKQYLKSTRQDLDSFRLFDKPNWLIQII